MNILIATGIYPPALGGPAKYAQELETTWKKAGSRVVVKTYTLEHSLPVVIRHFYYFIKILPPLWSADFVFALDTMSVGWPATCASRLFGKKIITRTGGDFLWESYVERTGDLVLLKDFYATTRNKWSFKERMIYKITQCVLTHASVLVFSTQWQRDIWEKAYDLSKVKTKIVENYFGPKESSITSTSKNFLAGTRKLKWKNTEMLKSVFENIPEAILDASTYPPYEFAKKMSEAYAVILVSLGDVSPNMILESIRHNKPFIITSENGLMDRIADIAIVVDPKNPGDIKEKVAWLCDEKNYASQVEKIRAFTFTHDWNEIAEEIISIYKTLV